MSCNFKNLDIITDWSGTFSNRPNTYYRIKSNGTGIPTTEFFDRSVTFNKVGDAGWYYEREPNRTILGLSFVYPDCSKTLEMVDDAENLVIRFTALRIYGNKVVEIQVNGFETGPSTETDQAFVSFGTFYLQ